MQCNIHPAVASATAHVCCGPEADTDPTNLVCYKTLNAAGERLLASEIFNTVLVLLVVTLGPVLAELFTLG
jgi:hypothetical protein